MKVLDLKFIDSIATIGAEDWNRLAGIENPFTRYEFLWALETTGCVTGGTGWTPHHAAVYSGAEDDEPSQLVAIMPLYQKQTPTGNTFSTGLGRARIRTMALTTTQSLSVQCRSRPVMVHDYLQLIQSVKMTLPN